MTVAVHDITKAMFKYIRGEEKDMGLSNNSESFFANRINGNDGRISSVSMQSTTPSTFWKSPYAGGDNMYSSAPGTRTLFEKPVISVTASKFEHKPPSNEFSKRFKSILKTADKSNSFSGEETAKYDSKNCFPNPKPDLITTGTEKAKPHGSPVRAKTASLKRVTFNGSTHNNIRFDPARDVVRVTMSALPYWNKGRRLFLDRNTSTRILGNPNRSFIPRNELNTLDCSGDVTIKTQVRNFITGLRLAERKRLEPDETKVAHDTNENIEQEKVAKKLHKHKKHSDILCEPDWREYDIDRIDVANYTNEFETSRNAKSKEVVPYYVYGQKSRTVSDNSSDRSWRNSIAEQVSHEQPQGATKIFRPRPNASFYTKYRHITTNDMNKYGRDTTPRPVEPLRIATRSVAKGKKQTNFCDLHKTNQILGWLEKVQSANSTQVDTELEERSVCKETIVEL